MSDVLVNVREKEELRNPWCLWRKQWKTVQGNFLIQHYKTVYLRTTINIKIMCTCVTLSYLKTPLTINIFHPVMQDTIFATNAVNRTRRICVLREFTKKYTKSHKKKNNNLKYLILSWRQILNAFQFAGMQGKLY